MPIRSVDTGFWPKFVTFFCFGPRWRLHAYIRSVQPASSPSVNDLQGRPPHVITDRLCRIVQGQRRAPVQSNAGWAPTSLWERAVFAGAVQCSCMPWAVHLQARCIVFAGQVHCICRPCAIYLQAMCNVFASSVYCTGKPVHCLCSTCTFYSL